MTRRLPSIITTIVTAVAGVAFTGTASDAAQATLNCPGTVQAGPQLATEVLTQRLHDEVVHLAALLGAHQTHLLPE